MQKNYLFAVIGLGIIVLGLGLILVLTEKTPSKSSTNQNTQTNTKNQEVATEPVEEVETTPAETDEKVTIETLKQGTGSAVSKEGDLLEVHYTGTLANGTKFDSSLDRNEPFSFTLGAQEVISGWDQGLVGMKIGEKRKLTIPPSLGYGDQAMGETIPANSVLIFEVELLSITPAD